MTMPLFLRRMGRTLGDVLVKDGCQLKPSQAFTYVIDREILPEEYPEFAIRAVQSECRLAYRRNRSAWRRAGAWSIGPSLIVALARTLSQAWIFVSQPPAFTPADMALPRYVAVARVLG